MSKIIAFEGHNGVGKTTIAKYLGDKYENEGWIQSYGVDNRFIDSELKEVFSCKTEAPWLPSFMYFITGAMEEHRQISKKDSVYIFERSFWSSLAAQWDQSEEAKQGMYDIIKLGKEFLPIPDLIIILISSYDTCMKRMEIRRKEKSDYDVTKHSFELERDFYQWLQTEPEIQELFGTTVIKINTDALTVEDSIVLCEKAIHEFLSEAFNKN